VQVVPAKTAWRLTGLAIGIVVAAGALIAYLHGPLWSPDPRPANVPADAVRIPIGKSNLWATCLMDGNTQTRCRIFNNDGYLLEDDVFLTYSGRPIVDAADLVIVPEYSGPSYLWLKNGDMLLPARDYAENKRRADRFLRTPSAPAADGATPAR
jgi:hypothetical protein